MSFENAATLMVHNVPPDLTPPMFVDILRSNGYAGTFDLLHVPRALKCGRIAPTNNGFAFVNFTDEAAWSTFVMSITRDGGRCLFGAQPGSKAVWCCAARLQGREQCLALWGQHGRILDPMVRPFGLDCAETCRSRCAGGKSKGEGSQPATASCRGRWVQ